MTTLRLEINARFADAFHRLYGQEVAQTDPLIRQTQDEEFGDYQSNCAMSLAKALGRKPREVAGEIADALRVEDLFQPPEIAGPGFINLRLRPEAIAERLDSIGPAVEGTFDRVGIEPVAEPQVAVVDFSSPNLAKEMHVGHLRSTVIGESVARILEFQGHRVHRINHVGDWGTQFGMLLTHLRRLDPKLLEHPDALEINNLESFYVAAKQAFDADPEFAAEARRTVVQLQSGDPNTLRAWKAFCDESLRHCRRIYERLGVRLTEQGESFYNDQLEEVLAELSSEGMVTESEGAQCIFLEGFKTRDGEPLPMIVRKSDGGFNYDTTDLAAIRYRLRDLHATMLIYIVGATQKLHFEQLFAATRQAGWADSNVRLEHLAFGSVLGPDGRPFKTREGGTVKLSTLIDGAVGRALEVLVNPKAHESDDDSGDPQGRTREMSREQMNAIAETVGTAALKYFDLSHNLGSDYKFDLARMCTLEGNTAPYMLYAYARIRSIQRKSGADPATLGTDVKLLLEHPSELRLAKALCRFPDVFQQVAGDLRPNVLTDYLYELSKAFSLFYDRIHGVRVLDASPDPVRRSRLRLCDLTARTLRLGLLLLGIGVLDEM